MGTYTPAVIEAVPASPSVPNAKRQRRSVAEKRLIVEETLVVGASVARIARAHGVNANQVFYWRQLYRAGRLGNPGPNAARLLPVSVAETTSEGALPGLIAPVLPTDGRGDRTQAAGTIQLELRKARIRIEGNIDPAVLRLVLQSVVG